MRMEQSRYLCKFSFLEHRLDDLRGNEEASVKWNVNLLKKLTAPNEVQTRTYRDELQCKYPQFLWIGIE